mgnify:CR=1 FL=1
MTKLLKIGLELAYNEDTPSVRKRLIAQIPKDHVIEHEGKFVRTRELLQATEVAGTGFIPEETLNTVIEGARLATCFTEAVPVYRTKSDLFNMPVGTGGGYAPVVKPGAQIPQREDALNTRETKIVSYKEAPAITSEMVADGQVDMMAREIELAGLRIVNSLNRDMLTVLLDNAGQEHDTAGSNQGYKAMIKARALLQKKGFMPNVVVACPEAEGMLLADLVPSAAMAAAQDAIATARLQSLDLQLHSCAVTDASATYTWEYDSDGDIGMLVLDGRAAGGIAMRQDLQVEDYKDPIRDLVGAKVTMRAGVNYAQANAICRVEF